MGNRLTKKFFLSIPEGLYLVSNLLLTRNQSIFAEKVVAHSMRETQWKRIIEAGAAQRLCYIYKNIQVYKKRISSRMTTRIT